MTTRRQIALVLTAAALASAASLVHAWPWGDHGWVRGSGHIVSEQRNPGSFDSISVSGDFKVAIRQSATSHVELRTDDNILPCIETRVVSKGQGATLEIGSRQGCSIHPSATPQVTLDMPRLRAIDIAGAADVAIAAFKGDQIDVSVAGAGDLNFAQLDVDALKLAISGKGDVRALGRAKQLDIAIDGVGDIEAPDLAADEVNVSISGAGNAVVRAARKLNISLAGAGEVSYHGAPTLSTSVAGVGSVKKLDH